MSFIIQWVEDCCGVRRSLKFLLLPGQLVLYSRQGVISKARLGT